MSSAGKPQGKKFQAVRTEGANIYSYKEEWVRKI